MSYATVFDAPHIFKSGVIDENKGETRQLFYRNATRFSINIKRVDIAGTPFEEEWSKYCVEGPGDRFKRWNNLCDTVIAHILPTLKELAPLDGRKWRTLQDYLDTPTYHLRLVKDDAVGDAVATVMSGPTKSEGPYKMEPQSFSQLSVPQGLPRIDANDVVVLDAEKDWRMEPEKVLLVNSGEIASLIVARSWTLQYETGVYTNYSLIAMSKVLECLKVDENINISKPLAIVTTKTSSDSELKIVGLLQTRPPETAQRLSKSPLETLVEASSQGLEVQWKSQIEATLKVLHSHDIVLGGFSQYDIWADSETGAWLTPGAGVDIPEGETGSKVDDLKSLDTVFDVWLKQSVDEGAAVTA